MSSTDGRPLTVRYRRLVDGWTLAVVAAIALLVGLEAALRLSGVVDFPTYAVDDGIGYLPQPNQSGTFLKRNHWYFNDRSMPIETPWSPAPGVSNILLIGNSIIMGGNPYDQKVKVAPQLQRDLGSEYRVWPIAAGGWTNVNESVYLERNPDIVHSADTFVWEYMKGGLSQLARWQGDYVFPRQRPVWATWYVFRRYVLPRFVSLNMNELPPEGTVNPVERSRFDASLARLTSDPSRFGLILLYPKLPELKRAQLGREWLPERDEITRLADKYHLRVVDLCNSPLWDEKYYIDGVHPTVEGNSIIAKIISAEIRAARIGRPIAMTGER